MSFNLNKKKLFYEIFETTNSINQDWSYHFMCKNWQVNKKNYENLLCDVFIDQYIDNIIDISIFIMFPFAFSCINSFINSKWDGQINWSLFRAFPTKAEISSY